MTIALRDQLERRADYTHKHNLKTGRHGWLRLTPAYSVKIVEELIRPHLRPRRIYDPFCGTGTTALSAVYHGHSAITSDVNPFLVWLATAKTAVYTKATIARTRSIAGVVSSLLRKDEVDSAPAPPIHNIKRWWSNDAIEYLCKLRTAIALVSDEDTQERTLLQISFCRTLMQLSNAAFNHQSMSFKDGSSSSLLHFSEMKDVFVDNVRYVSEGAAHNPVGDAEIVLGDARDASGIVRSGVDVVITSPPYANRMSYIRELRPYMYWLGFLSNGRDAGELDWSAIGGTWGVATSRLIDWRRGDASFSNGHLEEILRQVSDEKNPNGVLLANYIARYHDDIWRHLQSLTSLLNKEAEVNYIVGNSTFYGVLLPVETFYAEMLSQLGFVDVQCIPLRKRNSKKELIEFNVRATLK